MHGLYRAEKCYKPSEKRVLDSEAEAKALLLKEKEGYVIEVREGKASRCEGNYCNVAEFCSQYKGE